MRSKKALANIIASFALQLTTALCGLAVPRLIIGTFGSGINGLGSSISQFLHYIVLLEAGVGGVMRAALYKPLADKDIDSISSIIKASENFFRKVAYIYIGYLLILSISYPKLVNKDFDYLFTLSFVLIIGISTFFQYYFGISYQVLLQADQRQYISSAMQIITTIINTIAIVVLVISGANIHIVRLGSSFIFLLKPILLSVYVKRKYKIKKNAIADNNAIKQRWDGLGHHIAYLIHNNTDIAVLTVFANIREVSVYSVYYMVVMSIEKIVTTFSTGLEAAFGNMIAKDEKQALNRNFRIFEFSSFTLTTVLFTSTALLILPFISLYTKGITDANYFRPMFAYVLIASIAVYCIRIPYHAVVYAAGHYKQTRNGAFAEALINVVLSVVLVQLWGIVGVAVGTLAAMLFRTIQYAIYLSKSIIKRSIWVFIKRFVICVCTVILIIIIVGQLPHMAINTYIDWIVYAVIVTIIAFIITFTVGMLFYYNDIKNLYLVFKRIVKKEGN